MKKKKIMLGIVMILALAVMIGGCKEDKTKRKKQVDWAIAGMELWGFEREDSIPKEKVTELNQLLAEKGKDYRIKFHVITFNEGELSEDDEETLRKCDLITIQNQMKVTDEVKNYHNILKCVEKNMFEPLDEYMNTNAGRKIKEKMLSDLTLERGYWDGKQWLLPSQLPLMSGSSLRINKQLYEKCGEVGDYVPDFIECDELFEKLYVANGRRPFLVLSDRKGETGVYLIPERMPRYLKDMLTGGKSFYDSEVLGTGVLQAPEDDMNIRNLLKESYFEEYLNAWKRYVEKGYVNSNMDEKTMVEICNSNQPEMIEQETYNEKWVIPKSEKYTLYFQSQPAVPFPLIGIGKESKRKGFAFEILADMITDKELNEVIQDFGEGLPSEFVFHTGLSEEGERAYQMLIETIPRYTVNHTMDTFSIPEIAEINKVYAEYSTEEEDDSTQLVLERHFSKDGKVTEESIHDGIQRLNEKLDAAGMERFIEALKEQKKRSER